MEDKDKYLSDEQLAAFLDGNSNKEEASLILSSIASDCEVAEVLSLSQRIDKLVEEDKLRIIPMSALAAANPHNHCSFECETFILERLDIDIDHWTLLETAKANSWIREEGTPLHHVGRLLELKGLHVERKYDSSLSDLQDALSQGRQIITVVGNNILEGITSDRAIYHAIYITDIDTDCNVTYHNSESSPEGKVDKDLFLRAWKCSDYYMVTASYISTEYNPQPIDVGNIDLDADLEDLTEAIAENAHDIWARARMDEGWTYGPVRDDKQKHHPDLVPYAKLPDSEKQYDRIMAMNTLRLVRRLGFDIIKQNIETNDCRR